MYYNEHNPPHFHAKYGDFEALISINDMTIIYGSLPPRVVGLVMEWLSMHQKDLIDNWQKSIDQQPLEKITPLE